MKFGLDNALESDLFVKDYGSNNPQDFVQNISSLQKNLTAKYNELTAIEEGENNESATTFLPGTYVLVDNVKRSKNKVSGGKRSGPFKVLAQNGAAVELYDPTSKNTREVHISRCRLFHAREGEDPMVEALKYTNFFLVEKITDHFFKPKNSKKEKHLHLTVFWVGYEEPTLEFGKNLPTVLRTQEFRNYAAKFPELVKFIK